ncbi:MAG: GNAT family N-acetyltransferase [Alphaproteobacteria bacterium]|nr:GNAT family N-acetyltransferase [Alphaproteobacteria bacterium]
MIEGMSTRHIVIRPADRTDLPALNRLIRSSYEAYGPPFYAARTLAGAIDAVMRATPAIIASGRFYVAEDDRRVLGCGGWGGTPLLNGAADLRQVATAPSAAGRGVGAAIVAHCEAEAAFAGARDFDCVSTLIAEGFYARLGFRHLRFTSLTVAGQPFAAVLMRKRLTPQG